MSGNPNWQPVPHDYPEPPTEPAKEIGDDGPEYLVLDKRLFKAPMRLNPVQRARIIEYRREQIAKLMLRGYSEARMADTLGISLAQAHMDVVAVRKMWQDSTIDAVQDAATLDLARLEFAAQGLYAKIAEGDTKAVEALVRIIAERGAILGYRQGLQVDIETLIREQAAKEGFDAERAVEIAQRVKVTLP